MSQAKERIGTFCRYCGNQIHGIENIDFIRVPSKGYGKERFVCEHCAGEWKHSGSYSHEVNEKRGDTKETKARIQFAVEWECHFPRNTPVVNGIPLNTVDKISAYLASEFHLYPSHDFTVDMECKEERSYNLHGYKERIQGIADVVDLTRESSGHHINISKTSWNRFTGIKISDYSYELFAPLASWLNEHRAECRQIFGREFSSWSEFSTHSFIHGYWLNIRRSGNETCLEFRLAKFHDVNQFFFLINFCKEVTEMVDKWLTDTTGKITAENTGLNILECFHKYVNGKALCMRPERNSKTR